MAEEEPGQNALNLLMQGNRRYVQGRQQHPRQAAARRLEVAGKQAPPAIILSCSDSRVPPEIIFDQGLGDLFVIRTAGNVADDVVLGTIEYSVLNFHSPLLMILCHQRCGAVTAAVEGGLHPGYVATVTRLIKPAVEATQTEYRSRIEKAIEVNARQVADLITAKSQFIHDAQKNGELLVVAAKYSLDTGQVEVL